MRTTQGVTTSVGLYERIAAEIALLENRQKEDGFLDRQLAEPIFHALSSDRDAMRWIPKAFLTGAFAERVIEDSLLRVLAVRRMAPRKLLIRFLLKCDDVGPVRCVVILNGRHSVRISIKNGKIGRHRTIAELRLDIDPVAADVADVVFVEIVRDMHLLYIGELAARPTSLGGWIARGLHGALRLLRAPWMLVSRRRPVRVPATRLLEESFRIKAR